MGKVSYRIPDDLEERIRAQIAEETKGKSTYGALSNFVETAFENELKRRKKKSR